MNAGESSVRLSLDLNLTWQRWPILENRLMLGRDLFVDEQQLISVVSDPKKIFMLDKGALTPLEIRHHGYCKLVPTASAPILEIDGIKMHRSSDIDPLDDARQKIALVVRPGDRVLDTCGGLGYSAMFAARAGALQVVSFEKSKEVLQLRMVNPWLKTGSPDRMQLIHGDLTRQMDQLESESFHSVIHDPPRFTSSTGDLYGKVFYAGLFRVMKKAGRLFHYTGSPGKIKSQDVFIKNTMKRLENAGFEKVEFHDSLQGIYGLKK